MAAIDILFDIAPEFTTTDTAALARVNRFIGYATQELSADTWDTRLDMATALLTAHKLTLAPRGGSQVGPLISEKVGEMSATYASPTAPADKLDPLATTSYGLQFIQLRDGIYFGGILL